MLQSQRLISPKSLMRSGATKLNTSYIDTVKTYEKSTEKFRKLPYFVMKKVSHRIKPRCITVFFQRLCQSYILYLRRIERNYVKGIFPHFEPSLNFVHIIEIYENAKI